MVDALSSIGEPTRQAFVLQLEREGIPFSPDRIDAKGIESKLLQFFGNGANVIICQIYKGFAQRALQQGREGASFPERPDDSV
jgi:hypothetical protein